jgi:hypothetical protein
MTILLVGFELCIYHDHLSCRLYLFLVLHVTVQPVLGVHKQFAVFHGKEVNSKLYKFVQGIANGSCIYYIEWQKKKHSTCILKEIVCLIITCYQLTWFFGHFFKWQNSYAVSDVLTTLYWGTQKHTMFKTEYWIVLMKILPIIWILCDAWSFVDLTSIVGLLDHFVW